MSEEATLDEFIGNDDGRLSAEPQGVRLALDESYPKEWGFAELDEVCEVNSGFTWNKEQETDSSEDGAVPVIKIGNVQDGYLDLDDILYLAGVSDEDIQENKARKDWLLMIGSNGSEERVGHCGIIEEDMEFVYASFLYGIHADSDYLLPRFLFYSLNRPKVQQRLTSFTAGSTSLKNLNKSTIENLSIPTPPLLEQRKIATVLYTVDRAIEKIEGISEQIKRVKKALAQELIHTGIKNSQTKSAWMGEIPSNWDVQEFSEIVEFSQNGIYKNEEEYGGPHPIIKMGDIFGGVKLDDPISEQVYLDDDEIDKYGTVEGDLVFARHAQAGWGAGDCTYVSGKNETAVVESNMIQARLNDDVDPLFYAQYFNSEIGTKSVKRITTTGNIKSISQGDLMNLKIPVPPKKEQEEIAEILSAFDEQADHSESEVERLRHLKRGLQQDLFSGIVRTTDTNIEVPDEIAQHG